VAAASAEDVPNKVANLRFQETRGLPQLASHVMLGPAD
jgi:hypothetical protein